MRVGAFVAGAVLVAPMPVRPDPPNGIQLLEQYQVPALESEVGGIHPHATDDSLYYLVSNSKPAYAAGQRPKLPAAFRGKLLVVDRHSGRVVDAVPLPGNAFGGIASDGKRLFVSSLRPPEILVFDLASKKVERRIPLDAPAGGLAYDAKRGHLLAQIYQKHPQLAVIDAASGATVGSLWSDESAMDLKLVDDDLLCTWVSSFDRDAFSELRRIDPATGRVTGRLRLAGIHSSMAALDPAVSGVVGFLSLVTTNKDTGEVTIQKRAYDRHSVVW